LNLIPAGHHPHPKKIKAMFVSGRLPVGWVAPTKPDLQPLESDFPAKYDLSGATFDSVRSTDTDRKSSSFLCKRNMCEICSSLKFGGDSTHCTATLCYQIVLPSTKTYLFFPWNLKENLIWNWLYQPKWFTHSQKENNYEKNRLKWLSYLLVTFTQEQNPIDSYLKNE
jgi:hypothetical protein